jgi:hypothetical protein
MTKVAVINIINRVRVFDFLTKVKSSSKFTASQRIKGSDPIDLGMTI